MSDISVRLMDALRLHMPVEDGEGCFCSCSSTAVLLEQGIATDYTPDHLADVLLALPGIAIIFTHRLLDALYAAWDGGNATGLDGWVGPGRGTEPIDDDALLNRDRDVDRALAKLLAAAVQAQDHQ